MPVTRRPSPSAVSGLKPLLAALVMLIPISESAAQVPEEPIQTAWDLLEVALQEAGWEDPLACRLDQVEDPAPYPELENLSVIRTGPSSLAWDVLTEISETLAPEGQETCPVEDLAPCGNELPPENLKRGILFAQGFLLCYVQPSSSSSSVIDPCDPDSQGDNECAVLLACAGMVAPLPSEGEEVCPIVVGESCPEDDPNPWCSIEEPEPPQAPYCLQQATDDSYDCPPDGPPLCILLPPGTSPLPYDSVCPSAIVQQRVHDLERWAFAVVNVVLESQEDHDGDGVGDGWEDEYGPVDDIAELLVDSDSDELLNQDEFRWLTDPWDPDTDDDGLNDGPEAEYWDRFQDPVLGAPGHPVLDLDSHTDSDGDGKRNILDPDSDNDGLLDGEEYYGTYNAGMQTFLEFSDSDSDGSGDGLTDFQELYSIQLPTQWRPFTGGYQTDPLDPDTDNDGASDGYEAATWKTAWSTPFDCDGEGNNLLDSDSDGDSLPDGDEWGTYRTSPGKHDTDRDVMDDAFELSRGFVPTDPSDAARDDDADGLSNRFEYGLGRPIPTDALCVESPYEDGSNPRDVDTDDDTLPDGQEWFGTLNTAHEASYYEENPGATNIQGRDSDREGLTDDAEILLHGTDPNNPDTDGDGLSDWTEVVQIGSDPNDADTDNDGYADGSDPNPLPEQLAPGYPDMEAYLVFNEAGYLDLVIDDLNEREEDIAGISLSGFIEATDIAGNEIPYRLYFNQEVRRGDEGVWGARVALPPGIGHTTEEEIRLLVSDRFGQSWASVDTFDESLNGPVWKSSDNTTKEAGDWATLIEHTPEVAPPPDGEPSSVSPLGNLGLSMSPVPVKSVPEPRISVYRLEVTRVQSESALPGMPGIHITDEAFQLIGFGSQSSASAWGVPTLRNVGKAYLGVTKVVVSAVGDGIALAEDALEEAVYQSASFVFGCDHPAAHNRCEGDLLSGFLLWGDVRDCIGRPFFVNPDTSAEAKLDVLITALACGGAAIDIAQISPGAPGAVAANAILTYIKTALKMLQNVDPHLALKLWDFFSLCAGRADLCDTVGDLARRAPTNSAAMAGIKGAARALGDERYLEFVMRHPHLEEPLSRLAKHFDDLGDTAKTDEVVNGLFQATNRLGKTSDEMAAELLTGYDYWIKEGAGVVSEADAADFVAGSSRLSNVEGFDTWWDLAPTTPTQGILFEATHLGKNPPKHLQASHNLVPGGTGSTDRSWDAVSADGVAMELKSGRNIGSREHVTQLRHHIHNWKICQSTPCGDLPTAQRLDIVVKQVDAVETPGAPGNVDGWTFTNPSHEYVGRAKELARQEGLEVRLVDVQGQRQWIFPGE